MDNKTRDFAQSILSELREIKNDIHVLMSSLGQKHSGADAHQQKTNQSQRQPHANVAPSLSDPKPHPAVTQSQTAEDKSNRRYEWLKEHIVELAGVIVVGVYTAVTLCTLQTMRDANETNAAQFQMAQRPIITLGRKDGVIAEFSTSGQRNPVLLLYIQNAGHLPAYNVTASPTIATVPPISLVTGQTNHIWRKRNKKTGTISATGGVTIPGDSIHIYPLVNVMSQANLDQIRTDGHILVIATATVEFCDPFGNYHAQLFSMNYRAEPVGLFTLDDVMDITNLYGYPAIPKGQEDLEYIPPCDTPAERETKQRAENERIRREAQHPPGRTP